MNQIIKNTIILFVITLVAGFCLGAVHDVTLEPIAQAQEAAATKTFQEVYPEAASLDAPQELTDAVAAAAESISEWGYGKVTINDAKEALDASGNKIGYLITSTSAESYGGNVQIAVGISNEGELTGIGFLSISDTPGLGMRAKEPDFKDQFIGKKAEKLEVTKTGASADNQIQAISGATITSKAVTNATDAAIYFVANCLAQ